MNFPKLSQDPFYDFYLKSHIAVSLDNTSKERIAQFALGVVGEAIELYESFRNSEILNDPATGCELGDVVWYLCNLRKELEIGFYDKDEIIAIDNIRFNSYDEALDNVLSDCKDISEMCKKYLFQHRFTEIQMKKLIKQKTVDIAGTLKSFCSLVGLDFQACLDSTIVKTQQRYPKRFEKFLELEAEKSTQMEMFK